MKKIFLTIAVVLMAVAVNAQAPSFGLKGGLNLSTITSADDAKMKPSVYVGAFAEWKFTDFVGFAPELVYSRQGSAIKDEYLGEADAGKMRLNYLNVPLMVKLYVADGLTVDLGPQVGFLLEAKMWAKIDGQTDTEDICDAINKVDVSFGAGVTYNFTDRLGVSARYNIGLTKVPDSSESGASGMKNSVLQIGLSYRFF